MRKHTRRGTPNRPLELSRSVKLIWDKNVLKVLSRPKGLFGSTHFSTSDWAAFFLRASHAHIRREIARFVVRTAWPPSLLYIYDQQRRKASPLPFWCSPRRRKLDVPSYGGPTPGPLRFPLPPSTSSSIPPPLKEISLKMCLTPFPHFSNSVV